MFKKSVKNVIIPFLTMMLFTSCLYKNFDGSNDFEHLVENLVEDSSSKLTQYVALDDVVLVSDFVNLDKLKNHSKLGFLLADSLKNSLSSEDIIMREVELGEKFTIGERGFNLLSREQNKIYSTTVKERYAMVGTYSITTKRLIVFIKLIDIRNGNILSSSSDSMILTQEIIDLETIVKKNKKAKRKVFAPLVL